MAMQAEQQSLLEQFENLLQQGAERDIKEWLDEQNISDVAELMSEFPEQESYILSLLPVHRAASTFKILDQADQERVIREMQPYKIAELLNELPPDDRTSFLEELPGNAVKELIRLLSPEERKVTLTLLGYKEGSVGRMMTPDYISVKSHWTVQRVLDHIRHYGKDVETIDVIYVIDKDGHLVDDVRIREFLINSPEAQVSDIIDGRYITLNANDLPGAATEIFRMNNRVALPVIDDYNVLLGIVTIDDMLWIAGEEYSEDMQKMGGTEALDEPYLDTPFFQLMRKRAGWLIVLFLGELLTATALAYFNDEISRATVLVMFMPLIASSGGNSGSQASTLIIQAMAVGEVTLADWWRVMRREILSGLTLGGILGGIGFFRITIWHSLMAHGVFKDIYGPHWFWIAVSVACSLVGVVLWGTLTGSMLPLLLKRAGADPAVSSAPFVATLVDVTGILIYFSMAYLFLHGLLL